MLSSNQRGRLVFIQLVLRVIQGPLYDIENTDEIFIFFCLIPLKKVLDIQELTRALSTKIMNTEQNTCSVYLNTNFPYHIAMLKEPIPLVRITNLI